MQQVILNEPRFICHGVSVGSTNLSLKKFYVANINSMLN